MVARRSASKARTQTEQQLRSLILELDDDKRAQVDRRRIADLTKACATLAGSDGTTLALRALARRWQHLDQETRDNDQHVSAIIRRVVPGLVARPGIGPVCAAQLLVTAGDNPDRLHSQAAFAALCGASPVEHSSGKTQRHRLYRGGDRAANSALWIIANNRLMHDHKPAPTPPAAPPPAPATKRFSGCSSATSPARSSPRSATRSASPTPLPQPLDIGHQRPGRDGQRAVQSRADRATRPWRGADQVELATMAWAQWWNQHRLHGALDHTPPTEQEALYYRQHGQSKEVA